MINYLKRNSLVSVIWLRFLTLNEKWIDFQLEPITKNIERFKIFIKLLILIIVNKNDN
jgi:hypothetical protein